MILAWKTSLWHKPARRRNVHAESTSTVDQQEEKREVDIEDDPKAAVVMEL